MGLATAIHKHLFIEVANRFMSSIVLSAMVAPALRLFGATIGKKARVYSPLILNNTKFSNLVIGANCHVGRGVLLDLADRIEVGDNATISMNTTIITHIDMGRSPLADSEFPAQQAPVSIGAGTYIGAGVTILHGVTIGENSVVAAGSVVRNDVESGAVVAGVPAQLVRKIAEPNSSPSS